MTEFPHPRDIEDDLALNQANSMISNKKFTGKCEDRKAAKTSNGVTFISCPDMPTKGKPRNKLEHGVRAIEYNLEEGSFEHGAEIEFSARYIKYYSGKYDLTMHKGKSSGQLSPESIIPPISLDVIPPKGSVEERTRRDECIQHYNDNGFVVIYRDDSTLTRFTEFCEGLGDDLPGNPFKPENLKRLLSGFGPGKQIELKSPFVFRTLMKRTVKKPGFFADQFFIVGDDEQFLLWTAEELSSRLSTELELDVITELDVIHYLISSKRCNELKLSLLNAFNEHQSSEQNDAWVIVADESGRPDLSFKGENREAHMIFIAIPPGVKLPIIHPEYHSNRRHWIEHRIEALSSMVENEVKPYIFTVGAEGGRFREGVDVGHGAVANANMWQCIYLVLEDIAGQMSESVDLHVYFERHTDVQPGSEIYQDQLSQFRDLLRERDTWSNMHFPDGGAVVLSKGEHGLLSYSDVAGLAFMGDDAINVSYRKIEELQVRLKEQALHIRYDTDSINRVTEAIRASARGRVPFLDSVMALNEFDINEYATKFLRHHSGECINNLTESEWNTFNAKAQNMLSESSECWRAYEYLLSLFDGGIERLTAELNGDALLGALLGMLANANHMSDIAAAEVAKREITKLIDSNQPTSYDGKIRAINNLCVHYQNQFAFEEIDSHREQPVVVQAMEANSVESVKLRGTIMQNKAFLGRSEEALRDWNSLNDAAEWNGENLLRQRIYRCHILIDVGDHQAAQDGLIQAASEFMEYLGLPESDPIEALRWLLTDDRGLFLCAALFKAVSRASQVGLHDDKLLELLCSEDIERRLRRLIHYSKHPVQSIWFWAIKLLQGADDPQLAAELKNRLLENCDDTLRDAFGLMYACYRLDLSSDDSGEFDEAQIYFREIFERSTPSTREWVESRISSANDVESLDSFLDFDTKCDRLRPLTFNYL